MTIGRMAERSIGFLSGMALVRRLTKDEYCSHMQIDTVSQLAVTVLLFGLPTSRTLKPIDLRARKSDECNRLDVAAILSR